MPNVPLDYLLPEVSLPLPPSPLVFFSPSAAPCCPMRIRNPVYSVSCFFHHLICSVLCMVAYLPHTSFNTCTSSATSYHRPSSSSTHYTHTFFVSSFFSA